MEELEEGEIIESSCSIVKASSTSQVLITDY